MCGVSKSPEGSSREELNGSSKPSLNGPSRATGRFSRSMHLPQLRRDGRIISVAAKIPMGVSANGRREVRGMEIGGSEAEAI